MTDKPTPEEFRHCSRSLAAVIRHVANWECGDDWLLEMVLLWGEDPWLTIEGWEHDLITRRQPTGGIVRFSGLPEYSMSAPSAHQAGVNAIRMLYDVLYPERPAIVNLDPDISEHVAANRATLVERLKDLRERSDHWQWSDLAAAMEIEREFVCPPVAMSSWASPEDWQGAMDRSGRPCSESSWRRFRDEHRAESHPQKGKRFYRFPLSELAKAGIEPPANRQQTAR